MTLIVILLCLCAQRLFWQDAQKPQFNWAVCCYDLIESKLSQYQWWTGYMSIGLLLGLMVALYLLIIGLLTAALGIVFSFAISLLVLWYYLDARPLSSKEGDKVFLPELFVSRYYAIFAIIFWFVILGPLGAILYGETRNLAAHLKAQQETDVYFPPGFLSKLQKVRAVLDWAPVRLVGLTYALVGAFRPVFQYWYRKVAGLEEEPLLVVDYGMVALNWDPNLALSGSFEEAREVESLMNRALIVWLLILAVYTLGRFM